MSDIRIDDKTILFVVGMPRSGTTWLQLLLSSHPQIVTGRETHVFTRYVRPFLRAYDEEVSEKEVDGLHIYFSRLELIDEVLKPIVQKTLSKIAAKDSSASVILEKTPGHVSSVPLMQKMFGTRVKVLHVIRDPRAVIASWRAVASKDWGAWADRSVEDLAYKWARMQSRNSMRRDTLDANYLELRYEDLLANPLSGLAGIFDWLKIDVDDATLARIVADNEISSLKQTATTGDAADPRREHRENFFRTGSARGWENELSSEEIATIVEMAGERMVELGYPV